MAFVNLIENTSPLRSLLFSKSYHSMVKLTYLGPTDPKALYNNVKLHLTQIGKVTISPVFSFDQTNIEI